ncbi:hypothetical protein ONZ43_g3370 [Nemania bipapillata]|uniref:Uncharacterized protein n=1 Tax=Nemania bipapillata TaxID=110536 RepID=A0ACC2IX13_9PEZI|nr:hypothetical protein ONZ43_g3370 [Nemania bipapillata]
MYMLTEQWYLFGSAILAVLLYALYQNFFHPLSRYPGPLLARFTDYWRFRDVRGRQCHLTRVALHEKHGPVSPFYHPFQGWVGDKIGYNLFTTRDATTHSMLKQPVATAYSFKSALEFEPIVDECIETMVTRLDEMIVQSKTKKPCDLGAWMQYYSFDVMAIMTWGKAFGFLDRGEDVNSMIQRLDERMDVISPQSQMPWLDWLQTKNGIVNLFRDRTNKFATLAASLIQERQKALADGSAKPSPRLFIDHFLDAQRMHPTVVDARTIVIYTTTNIMAGSDTVAIALRTILYMVMRHADVRERLLAEIDTAKPSFPVTWEEAQRLPYLDAVIQESLRIHPPVGLPLERVVPAEGLMMQDAPIWGPEPKTFNPSRWLKAVDESAEEHTRRVAAMKRASLAFGAGSRTCMGRHLSLVQIAKLVPSLLIKFKLTLVDKERDWKVTAGWFVRQAEMDVFIESK